MIKILLLFLIAFQAHAFRLFDQQVNIGDRAKPDPTTILQLSSTDKGFVVPRMTEAQRDAIVSPITGLEIYNTTSNSKQVFDGLKWIDIGADNVSFRVTQAGHGRPLGCPHTPVYYDGAIWQDAQADSQPTLGTHVIIEVIDVNTFVVAQVGKYNCSGHGLLTNTHYFVSDTVAGGLVTVEPEVYSNPMLYVESASIIHVMNLRASANTGNVRTGAVDSVFGRNGDVVAVAGDYNATQITFTPSGNLVATDVDGALQELDLEKVPTGTIIDALAAFNSDGLLTQTSTGNFTSRAITAASTKVSVTNGDGVAGNPSIDVVEANIDHDLLLNFSANEHIDWTSTTQNLSTSGTLSSGPATITGDIAVSGLVDGRDIQVDGSKLDGVEALADVTDAANVAAAGAVMDFDFLSDGLMVRTAAGSYTNRSIISTSPILGLTNGDGVAADPTFSFDETLINIQNLLNYNANADVDHTSVLIDVSNPDDGLVGGGDISASRILQVDINTLQPDTPDNIDEIMFFDIGTNFLRKATTSDFTSGIVASIDPNRLIDHSLVSITGGEGISGGGTLQSSSTLDLDVTGLPLLPVPDNNDEILIFDVSTASHAKQTKSDFIGSLPPAPVASVFGRTGAIFAQVGDYNTDQVTEGTNLYFTAARFDTEFATRDTGDLPEGANLYFTDERAQDSVGGILTDTATVNMTYNDAGNLITADVISSAINHSDINDDEPAKHRLINDAGSSTTELLSSSEIASRLSTNSTSDRARANHTGTQSLTTISEFPTPTVPLADVFFHPKINAAGNGVEYFQEFHQEFHRQDCLINNQGVSTYEPYITQVYDIPIAGDYIVEWGYRWSHDDATTDFQAHLRINGVIDQTTAHHQEPKDAAGVGPTCNTVVGGIEGLPTDDAGTDQFVGFSHSHLFTGLSAGLNTIVLEFAGAGAAGVESTMLSGYMNIRRRRP